MCDGILQVHMHHSDIILNTFNVLVFQMKTLAINFSSIWGLARLNVFTTRKHISLNKEQRRQCRNLIGCYWLMTVNGSWVISVLSVSLVRSAREDMNRLPQTVLAVLKCLLNCPVVFCHKMWTSAGTSQTEAVSSSVWTILVGSTAPAGKGIKYKPMTSPSASVSQTLYIWWSL